MAECDYSGKTEWDQLDSHFFIFSGFHKQTTIFVSARGVVFLSISGADMCLMPLFFAKFYMVLTR